MFAYRPELRSELVYVQKPEGGALYDPIVNRTVNLGAISRALVRRLDGQRPLDEILDEVEAEIAGVAAAPTRATVEHTFRTLLLMNLVQGAGRPILERVAAVRNGEVPFEPVFLDGSRFGCQGSGSCCQSYSFGPLDEEDIRAIEAIDDRELRAKLPQLGEAPLFEIREWKQDQRIVFLHTVDDRCIFLQSDKRCGLHAHFGPTVKPRFCRLYPLEAWPTIDGLKITDRGECASFATSSRTGLPIVEDWSRIQTLLPEHPQLQHPIVFLDGTTPCDYGWMLALGRYLVALVDRRIGTAGDTLRAIARAMGTFVDGLRACPLAPGEPDATVEQLLAVDPASHHVPVERDEERAGLAAISRVAGELLRALTPGIAENRPSSTLPRELGAILHLLQALAAHRADPDASAFLADYNHALALPVDAAELDEVMRTSFKQHLFGSKLLVEDRPLPALSRLAFVYLATVVGAKLHATIDGAPRVGARHLSTAHMLAERMLRRASCVEVFLAHEAEAYAILAAAPSLTTAQ